jgi:hypothetical protein
MVTASIKAVSIRDVTRQAGLSRTKTLTTKVNATNLAVASVGTRDRVASVSMGKDGSARIRVWKGKNLIHDQFVKA